LFWPFAPDADPVADVADAPVPDAFEVFADDAEVAPDVALPDVAALPVSFVVACSALSLSRAAELMDTVEEVAAAVVD